MTIVRKDGGADELIERLRLQVGRLDISPEELEGRSQRSALFKTMFLAFRAAGARDWRSNLAIALNHKEAQHKLQFHHIFPKAVLKGKYLPREAEDVANLRFISGKTNLQISDKDPSQYFPDMIEKAGDVAFEKQCIPIIPTLLSINNYKEFLQSRRVLIAKRLNDFLSM